MSFCNKIIETFLGRQVISFIDYTKAFKKVQNKNPLEILENLKLHGKCILVICNLY